MELSRKHVPRLQALRAGQRRAPHRAESVRMREMLIEYVVLLSVVSK